MGVCSAERKKKNYNRNVGGGDNNINKKNENKNTNISNSEENKNNKNENDPKKNDNEHIPKNLSIKNKLKNNCNKNQLKTENNYDNKNFEKKDSKNNYTELPSGKESKELQPLNFDEIIKITNMTKNLKYEELCEKSDNPIYDIVIDIKTILDLEKGWNIILNGNEENQLRILKKFDEKKFCNFSNRKFK